MSTLTPYIKFGEFKSRDENKPDVLELQIVDPETFDTKHSINIRVSQQENDEWIEKILPLKNHDSTNDSLLREWEMNARKDITRKKKFFKLKTWLGISKNQRPIRRYDLIFY